MIFSTLVMSDPNSDYFKAAMKVLKPVELFFLCQILSEVEIDADNFYDGAEVVSITTLSNLGDMYHNKTDSEAMLQKLKQHNFVEVTGNEIFVGTLSVDVKGFAIMNYVEVKKVGIAHVDFKVEKQLLLDQVENFPKGRSRSAAERVSKKCTEFLSAVSMGKSVSGRDYGAFWSNVYYLVYQDSYRALTRADYGILKNISASNGVEKFVRAVVNYVIVSADTSYCDPKGLSKDFSKYVKTTKTSASDGFA